MDLLAISDFVLVAGAGGVGAASRKSGRPKATLSRRVAELEEGLGVRLFERGGRALKLTDEGLLLFNRAESLLGDLKEVEEDVRNGRGEPRGRLRVSAPVLCSQLAMGRIAAGFAARHPEVRLEVVAEDRRADLIEDGFDVAVRINPPADTSLVGRCILKDPLLVVAPPGMDVPKGDSGFAAVLMSGGSAEPSWAVEDRSQPFRPAGVLTLSSLTMVRDAVLAGAGAALLPTSVVGSLVTDGKLALWGALKGAPTEIWVLHTSRRLTSTKVRAFVEFLSSAFPDGRLA